MGRIPISEGDLHAYLDGELPEARRRDVEAYLGEHPREAARLDAYRNDGEAISRLFSRASLMAERGHGRRGHPVARWQGFTWQRVAAVLAVFAIGAASGWFWRDRGGDDALRRFGHQAEMAYFLLDGYAVGGRPSTPLDELSATVSTALATRITLHEKAASGLSLTGVRIVRQPDGPAVQLAYALPGGQTVTLYFAKRPGARDTAFRPLRDRSVTTLVWEEENLGCAITGQMSSEELAEVARQIYASLLS